MAIINNSRKEEYNKIRMIIEEVLSQRKFKFDINTIFDVIKKKALVSQINAELLNCSEESPVLYRSRLSKPLPNWPKNLFLLFVV